GGRRNGLAEKARQRRSWRAYSLPPRLSAWGGVKVVCGLVQLRLGGVVVRDHEPCAPPRASARPTQTPVAAPPVPGWAPAVLLGRRRLRPPKTQTKRTLRDVSLQSSQTSQ